MESPSLMPVLPKANPDNEGNHRESFTMIPPSGKSWINLLLFRELTLGSKMPSNSDLFTLIIMRNHKSLTYCYRVVVLNTLKNQEQEWEMHIIKQGMFPEGR